MKYIFQLIDLYIFIIVGELPYRGGQPAEGAAGPARRNQAQHSHRQPLPRRPVRVGPGGGTELTGGKQCLLNMSYCLIDCVLLAARSFCETRVRRKNYSIITSPWP